MPKRICPSELLPTKKYMNFVWNSFAFEEHANSFLRIKHHIIFISELVTDIDHFCSPRRVGHKANRLSVQYNAPMNMVSMVQPVSCFWSICNSSSIYTLKRIGDNTQPCRTSLDTLMENVLLLFYVAFTLCLVYRSNTIIQITLAMLRFNNRLNDLGKDGRINNFLASKHAYTLRRFERYSENRSHA